MNSFDLSAPNISRDDLKFSATINTMMVDDDIISDTICVSDDDLFFQNGSCNIQEPARSCENTDQRVSAELYESVIDSYLKMHDV